MAPDSDRSPQALTILGGGNTAFSVAAELALAGRSITLCEIPSFAHTVERLREVPEIALDGVAHRGNARLASVTTDFGAALSENELALLIVPAYAHKPFAEACAAHLRRGQTVVLLPGTLGALEFAELLRRNGGAEGVTVAEVDTAPYVCRKITEASAHIWGIVSGLGLGVWPARESERVLQMVEPLFPGTSLYPHALACGFSSMNPVVHPAGVLMNAGRIERSRGDFYFYDEGVTPAVCRVIYAVDRERLAVAKALDVELIPVDEAFHQAGFGPRGDLWATINGSEMLTALRAPGSLDHRWLSEDVPYGIATWALIGEQFGIECPTMRALVELNSSLSGTDFWAAARTPDHLGIAGMSKDQLLSYLCDATK